MADDTLAIRALHPEDLDEVVAIDAALQGRRRRGYIERRLEAAVREPALHAQFAAVDSRGLAGFILARVLEGEFGRRRPGIRLEMVGVRDGIRREGVGTRLFEALLQWGERHGLQDLRTSASWRSSAMLHWFDRLGFELAPHNIVDCAVGSVQWRRDDDSAVSLESGRGPGGEVDFGAAQANDYDRQAYEHADVRVMTEADLAPMARIDRAFTGVDRSGYLAAQLREAAADRSVRVSLAAECDGTVVGYLMARADMGDFGRTEPVAVIDTLGVDADYAHRGIGHAMLAQLFANLTALQIERVETVVAQRDLSLLGFLYDAGFAPSQRLAFVRDIRN